MEKRFKLRRMARINPPTPAGGVEVHPRSEPVESHGGQPDGTKAGHKHEQAAEEHLERPADTAPHEGRIALPQEECQPESQEPGDDQVLVHKETGHD
jgi:hypothetical protein